MYLQDLVNRLNSFSRKKLFLIVFAILSLQLIFLSVIFVKEKKGCYSDDTYSFTTAASSVALSPIEGDTHMPIFGQWLDGSLLKNSVMLTPEEVWDYGISNRILRYDAHPPLYFYLVHFFCSFFINRVSLIPGLLANAVSFIILQLFLYRLSLLLSRSRIIALSSMIFFGFSTASINFVTFIRMYILMTAFLLGYTYYSLKMLFQLKKGCPAKKSLIGASVFLFLSAMSQYQSLLFAFILTLLICIGLFLKKRCLDAFVYGLSMCDSVILLPIAFPDFWNQLGYQSALSGAASFPFRMELRYGIHLLLNEIFGISISLKRTLFWFWVGWGCVFLVILWLIITFLFRNEAWPKKIMAVLYGRLKDLFRKALSFDGSLLLILSLTTLLTLLISCWKLKIYIFFPYSDRYLFYLYPYVAMLSILLVYRIFRFKPFLAPFALGIMICSSLIFGNKCFLFNEIQNGTPLSQLAKDADLFLLGDPPFVANVTMDITDCHSFFYIPREDLEDYKDLLFQLPDTGRPLYLLYDKGLIRTYDYGDFATPEEALLSDFDLIKSFPIATSFEIRSEGNLYFAIQLR